MWAKAIAAALALCAVVVMVLPGGAAAAAGTSRRPPEADVFLSLPGSNGFELILFLLSGRAADLSATKATSGAGVESVNYASTAHGEPIGSLKGRDLDLRFGRRGRFHAHFVTKSIKTNKPERGCAGDPTIEEQGVFVGTFDFHGERGFTDLHATRAKGLISRTGAVRCVETSEPRRPAREKSGDAREAKEREGEFRLLAGNEAAGYNVLVDRPAGPGANKPASVTVSASSEEKVGALQIDRSASVDTSGTSASSILQTPNPAGPLAEATLQPPAPFSGSATFTSDGSGSASWTGDLAVSLPGAAPLALTGDGTDAGACLGASTCTKTLPELLQLDLEVSGGDGSFYGATTTVASVHRAKKSSR